MTEQYSVYNPGQAVQDYEARKQQAMARLYALSQAQQAASGRLAQDYMTRQQEIEAQKKALAERQQSMDESALDEAAAGASMGMSAGGPWGALVGGFLGHVTGTVKGIGARNKKGMDPWKNALLSLGDFSTGGLYMPVKDALKGNTAALEQSAAAIMPAAAQYGGSYMQGKFGGPSKAQLAAEGAQWAAAGNAQADTERGLSRYNSKPTQADYDRVNSLADSYGTKDYSQAFDAKGHA